MFKKLTTTDEVKKFLEIVSGMTTDKGNPRAKKIVHRILTDLFNTIEDLDVQPDEFWAAVDYFNDLGQSMEAGLLTPGLGLEHFLDLRLDAKDVAVGVTQGTPRQSRARFMSPMRRSRKVRPGSTMVRTRAKCCSCAAWCVTSTASP